MKKSLLRQVMDFQENKHLYSKEERVEIKKTILKTIDKRLRNIVKKYLDSIDDINLW